MHRLLFSSGMEADLVGWFLAGMGIGMASPEALWGGSDVVGRLDALRSLLAQPDQLWEQFLTEAGRVLPLQQYAVAGTFHIHPARLLFRVLLVGCSHNVRLGVMLLAFIPIGDIHRQ